MSEVFQEDGVYFLSENLLDVSNRLRFVPFELLNKVADAVVSFMEQIIQQAVFFSLELLRFL